jgi:hypothetical protein
MLAQQDLRQLINQATVKLAGASSAAIKAELFDVLAEFFDISSAWQESIPIDGVAFQTDYTIVPQEGQIIRLEAVTSNSLFPTNAAYLAAKAATPGGNIGAFTPITAIMPTIGTISLAQLPNAPVAMQAIVTKNVSLPTTRDQTPIGPDWVLPIWHRYILDGILGKMMGTQNKSYTNDALSVYHLKKFQEGIARARSVTLAANTKGGQAWQFPRDFRTNTQRGYLNVSTGTDQRF